VEIKIRGFGACMIGGFPHRQEDSFLHLAVERLRAETPHPIVDSLFTMGGFPVTRVPKHFAARCLAAQPHIVVLQFGSTDLVVPLRRHHHHGSQTPIHGQVSPQLPDAFDRLKWAFRSVVGAALGLPSVTPPATYVATMTQLARTLAEHGVTPVVLSPFVFGSRHSDRIARDCVERLRQELAAVPAAVFVDVYAALDREPRRRMLLRDGSHLSLAAQRVVADVLFPVLKRLVEQGTWGTEKPLGQPEA